MEKPTGGFTELSITWRRFARQLLVIGENRLELLTLEVKEGRERLLCAALLALGAAAFGLVAAITLTAAIVLWLWAWSPAGVLLILTALYAAAAGFLWWRLDRLVRNWHAIPASLDQLRKDRNCLEKFLE
ncbi:MAG TPA: phage holin family protein [Verrucomicrobiae bacterium]|jgi:uncharacterized membrane protein YqjE|nr:phage holin family protein [Verrucomicrobiae bacterium]